MERVSLDSKREKIAVVLAGHGVPATDCPPQFIAELLTVELEEAEVEEIFQMVGRYEGLEATVDLDHQRVTLHLPEEISFHFEIDPAIKDHLTHGRDPIGITLHHEKDITAFESHHNLQRFG